MSIRHQFLLNILNLVLIRLKYTSCLIYATNIHVPVDTFGNSGKTNLETTKSMI